MSAAPWTAAEVVRPGVLVAQWRSRHRDGTSPARVHRSRDDLEGELYAGTLRRAPRAPLLGTV